MKKISIISVMLLGFMLFMPNAAAATDELQFCVRTSAVWQFVGYGLLAVKVLVPIIIIIFGLIDFAKAMTSGDDKAIKSAASSLIKRLIVGVVIFFIPTVVDLVFMVMDNFVGDLSAADACKTCLLSPTNSECNRYKNQAESLRKEGKFTGGGQAGGNGAEEIRGISNDLLRL